ncbi:hypothetical protein NRIC_26320 [Enterococcus florum]|uniref:SpaA-like prealbumin fold domain-containing protein n=1 Tax=Enterococcus florum TaxID=2480627 RepID=A0A4P5PEJ0_9ENTE|nr:hypothetical protein NRIC_26320 [Enterococcus florum]
MLQLGALFPEDSQAVVDAETILDNERVKVSYRSKEQEGKIVWTLYYERKAVHESATKLKLQMEETADMVSTNWEHEHEWWIEKDFSYETKRHVTIETSLDKPQLLITLQVDEQSDSEKLDRDVLLSQEEGPYTLEHLQAEPAHPQQEIPLREMMTTAFANEAQGKDLILSDKTIANKVEVDVASQQGRSEYQPNIVHKPNKENNSLHDLTFAYAARTSSQTYKEFVNGSGSVVLAYDRGGNSNPYVNQISNHPNGSILQYRTISGKTENEEITLTYDHVGAYETLSSTEQEPEYVSIGAKITLTNIVIGPSPSWVGWKAEYSNRPWMEFSTNLFSGVVYGFINKFDIQFEFFEADDPSTVVNLVSSSAGTLTFASLNGYGNSQVIYKSGGTQTRNSHEFAGSLEGKTGVLGEWTTLAKHSGNFDYDKDVYYSNVENTFTDYLGGATFYRAAVTFPLEGTAHRFKFGSTYGRAWNSFASSSVRAIQHKNPTKTVQPIKQYQAGDTWENPTGENSGFAERFYNDLDRYEDGIGTWDLPEEYRAAGHDAEDPASLAPGVPEKADRYVSTGQDYYYYINQETINVVSGSVMVPETFMIEDQLPEGIELGTQWPIDAVKLFNLDGNEIPNAFEQVNLNSNKLTLEIAQEAMDTINTLSGKPEYRGKAFTVQIRVKVTNTTDDRIPDLMENQAMTKAIYYDETIKEANSNRVHTRVKAVTVDFQLDKRITGTTVALAEAGFALFDKQTGGNKRYGDFVSNSEGIIRFTDIEPGSYWLREVQVPEGFIPMNPVQIHIDEAGNVDGLDQKTVFNTLKNVNLVLNKQDRAQKKPLAGAVFVLKDTDGQTVHTFSEKLSEPGRHTLEDVKPGRYTLEEQKAPKGYQLLGELGVLTLSVDGKITFQKTGDPQAEELQTTINEETIEVVLPDALNEVRPFELSIFKKAAEDGRPLAGAEFALYEKDPADETAKVVATAKTESAGIGKFMQDGKGFSLGVDRTYFVKETKAPDAHVLLKGVFKVVVSATGEVAISYEGTDLSTDRVQVDLTESGDNQIQFIVENTSKTPLPKTGGEGRMAVVLFGTLSALAAAWYLVRVKREVV